MVKFTQLASILCDDIRTEIGNKVSLMGVYGRDIRVSASEAHIARLSLYKQLVADKPVQCEASLDLIGPSGQSVLPHAVPRLESIKVAGDVNLGLSVGPLRLTVAGEYSMRLTLHIEGSDDVVLEHVFALRLNNK